MKISGHASPEAVLVASFTSTAIAIVTVILRLWTRIVIVRQPGWDDWLAAAALVFLIVFTACVGLEVKYGLGHHFDTISLQSLNQLLLALWISVWNYYIGLGLAKLSIVVQCMRIFGHVRSFRISSYILGTIIVVFMLYSAFISIFLCCPVSYFWHPEKEGNCIPKLPLWLFNSAFTMVTDVAVTVLPMPQVRKLQLPKRQRRLLMALFGVGGMICLVSIVRLAGIYATTVAKDVSWENSLAALYSNVELAVGIIVGCVPTLKAFCMRYFPCLASKFDSSAADATPLSDLSVTNRTIGGGRMPDWKSKQGGIVSEIEHAHEPSLEPPPRKANRGEISVTTIVEQCERRRDQMRREESSEELNPVTPFERP